MGNRLPIALPVWSTGAQLSEALPTGAVLRRDFEIGIMVGQAARQRPQIRLPAVLGTEARP